MPNPNIAAIVIAAGYSSRMGAFKPLLPLGDLKVIDFSINLFHSIGIKTIYVVTGFKGEDLSMYLTGRNITCLFNENYDHGMFSSIVAGVKALPDDIDGFFMLPADIPLVSAETLTKLVNAFYLHPCKVVYPSMDYKKGHPPLISSKLRTDIIHHDGSTGLKGVLKKYDSDAEYVSVDDPGILLDMDTPEAYNRLQMYYKQSVK